MSVVSQAPQDATSQGGHAAEGAVPGHHGRPARAGRVGGFLRHLAEMVLAMMVGMAIYGGVRALIDPSAFSEALRVHLDARYLAMALFMAGPMVLLMRYRGHGWRRTGEMVGAMVVPVAAACLLWRAGVGEVVPALSDEALGTSAHVAMYVGMLLAMLYRFGDYSHAGPHAGGHAPPHRDLSAHPRSAEGAPLKEKVESLLEREGNKRLRSLAVTLYRLTSGRFVEWTTRRKVDVLLLTTRGRRSGRPRTVILQFFPDGRDLLLVAANPGGVRDPDWYRNLEATPTARVEVLDRAFQVRAQPLSAAEAVAWWPRVLRIAPGYARYRRVSRAVPLVRLVPLEPAR
jgi:deazaflavin-dependent oxidoreductase (nitroreductase family)